jgi:hypothetical protein
MNNFGEKVSFIWSVADLLRGPYRPNQYKDVMLPMTVLRRLDCVLEPTKDAVLARLEKLEGGPVRNVEPILNRVAGQAFHNTSRFTFEKLRGDQAPDNTLLNFQGDVGDTVEVGTHSKGKAWCGAYDMTGNVWEWIYDWFGWNYYSGSPPQDPKAPPAGDSHVMRGGHFESNRKEVRAAQRDYFIAEWAPLDLIGFRCVVPGDQ